MKKTNPKEETTQTLEDDKRILKIASCPSRTGASTLTYHIGCDEDQNLFIRLFGNSGNGYFNKDWIALDDIEAALRESPFTSYALRAVYPHQSTNSPGFLLAALLEEKLVTLTEKRCYLRGDFEAFQAAMQTLIESDASLNDKPPKITQKRSIKGT